MRKGFSLVCLVFLLAGLVLVLVFEKEDNQAVSWLTRMQTYNRLLRDREEVMSVIVYSSTQQTFLLQEDLIVEANLSNLDNLLAVDIQAIRNLDIVETYQDEQYYAFAFDLAFTEAVLNQTSLLLPGCFLNLTYQNGASAGLEIGDVYLHFYTIDNPPHLDMHRLYGVYEPGDDAYMNGLVLGLADLTGQSLEIEQIDLMMPNVAIDSAHAKTLNQAPAYMSSAESLLGLDWNPLGIATTRVLDIEGSKLYYLPLKYKETLKLVERFPLAIHYRYQDQSYTYWIDDFLFQSQNKRLEDYGGLIRAYDYHY